MTRTPDLTGKQLGDYQLINKLASGGMAHIYIGEDVKLGRRAAIKILTPDMAGAGDMLKERFEREARAIANLEHDSIVPVYQFGHDDDEELYFIAMRYIEGNDLADEMKKYQMLGQLMPTERWLSILDQIASALDYAHRRGIIHRDIKPSNILVGENDKAVLSDFGLVLWESVDKTLGTAFGTPRYISPEQATDSQTAVAQSDIYSLAVIVYELTTGEVMFTGNSPMEVALSHITQQPTPPRAHNPKLPPTAQNEIMKALQKDASKRHQSASAFISALQRAFDDSGDTDWSDVPDDTSTIAFMDDDASTYAILDDWEGIPAPQVNGNDDAAVVTAPIPEEEKPQPKADQTAPQAVEAPAPKRKKRRGSRIITLFSMLIMAAVIFLFYYHVMLGYPVEYSFITDRLLNNIGETEATPVSPTTSTGAILIRYNNDFWAAINTSNEQTLDISSLSLFGAEGRGSDVDIGTKLLPGTCAFVMRNNANQRPGDLPDEWGCSSDSPDWRTRNPFWEAVSATDQSYSIRGEGGTEIATCETIGNIVGRTDELICQVTWPYVIED